MYVGLPIRCVHVMKFGLHVGLLAFATRKQEQSSMGNFFHEWYLRVRELKQLVIEAFFGKQIICVKTGCQTRMHIGTKLAYTVHTQVRFGLGKQNLKELLTWFLKSYLKPLISSPLLVFIFLYPNMYMYVNIWVYNLFFYVSCFNNIPQKVC